MSRTKKTEPPDAWHTSDDPLRLIRRSRHVANPRRFVLLACGIVRRWPGGVRSELGQAVLSAIEKEVRPHDAPDKHLARVLLMLSPKAFQLSPNSTPPNFPTYCPVMPEGQRLLGHDACWAEAFFRLAYTLRSATKALPNVLIERALGSTQLAAVQACDEDVEAIRQELMERQRTSSNWFAERLGLPVQPPTQEQIDEAILARFPEPLPAYVTTPGVRSWHARSRLISHHVNRVTAATKAAQCDLIREIFGDPFRPWRPDPALPAANDGAARRLAQGIEDSGDFATMPILGDALEDAGCGDASVLEHCRKPGPHAPGCWVLDALLRR